MTVKIIPAPSSGGGGIAAPTMPTFVAAGTVASAGAGGTATPGLPTGWAQNDILIVVAQFPPSTAFTATPNDSGYALLGPQNGIGSSGAGTTQLTVWWKRAGSSESAPSLSIGGGSDHVIARMIAVRGCPTSGDPFHLMMQTCKTTASTSLTTGKAETSVDQCFMVYAMAHAVDSASAQFSGATNADLTSLTEQIDDSTATGTGGGIVVVTGEKAAAGPIVATTGTWANSTVDITTCFAMIPADASNIVSRPRACEIQTFFPNSGGSAQTWVKSTGARWVDMSGLGGGGGAGNARTAATAAAGGGGGGGGWTRKIYRANDLPSTLNVAPGVGGTGGASNANGGNSGTNGTDSTVGTGPAFLLVAGGGKLGAGAASNSGGLGGAGGGRGTAPAAANPGTEGRGGQGGGGGSTDTNAAGGAGDEGGGGGGSGGSPTAGAVGGSSQYGGGGGGSGSNNAAAGGAGGRGGSGSAGGTAPGGNGVGNFYLTNGGGGGAGGDTGTGQGGRGGFPGGGGGGGGGQTGSTAGGPGADGIITIATFF